MPATPAVMPEIIPADGPALAIPGAPELQVPPAVISESVVVALTHTYVAPVIDAGNGLMVIVTVLIQPVFKVYVITVVPADTPVTIPVADPTLPMPGYPELQVPPVVASLRLMVSPTQTFVGPVMVAGNGLTVTVLITVQPVGNA